MLSNFNWIIPWILCALPSMASPERGPTPELSVVHVNWMRKVPDGEVAVGLRRAYAYDGKHAMALSLDTGETVWEHDYSIERCWETPIVVEMGKALVLACGRVLVIADAGTGRLRKSITFEEKIAALDGPPLVLQLDAAATSDLVSVDLTTGKEIARCGEACRSNLEDFAVQGRTVIVLVSGSKPAVEGLDTRFKRSWRIERQAPPSLSCSDRGLLLSDRHSDDSSEYRVLDPATGKLAESLEVASCVWGLPRSRAACGQRDFRHTDLCVTVSADCEETFLARYEGSPSRLLWTTRIDGCQTNLAKDSAHLYVTTRWARRSGEQRRSSEELFYVVDRATGKVVSKATCPLGAGGSVPFVLRGTSIISVSFPNTSTWIHSISTQKLDPPSVLDQIYSRLFDQ